jgi:1,4-dihydroxy-6-naphthoate synthase
MTTENIRLGISTCPNDTFAFHGLLTGAVDCRGLHFEVELLDIQELNNRFTRGVFTVAKTSFHKAIQVADTTVVLPSGAALGFGVGPLLLAASAGTRPTSPTQRTLCPGRDTTAALLFQLFYGEATMVEQVLFSDIMPRLVEKTADFGVCIHEGRFTWEQHGLSQVEDLGSRWEDETATPLPLGGLVASRRLAPDVMSRIQQVIYDSIQYGRANPAATLPTMRAYAQEFSDEVLMQHVDLYVNDWTVELGDVGQKALATLSRRAAAIGIGSGQPLEIFSGTLR